MGQFLKMREQLTYRIGANDNGVNIEILEPFELYTLALEETLIRAIPTLNVDCTRRFFTRSVCYIYAQELWIMELPFLNAKSLTLEWLVGHGEKRVSCVFSNRSVVGLLCGSESIPERCIEIYKNRS